MSEYIFQLSGLHVTCTVYMYYQESLKLGGIHCLNVSDGDVAGKLGRRIARTNQLK